ncbi:hypothetical protein Tco_1479364 [Tanacetum coccineum]
MKEILHDQMFKSGYYRSQPKHVALYEALEASMDPENRGEFLEAIAKSRKRRCGDQDPPPPPPPDSDQSKKKRHDSDMLLPALQSKSLIPNLNSQLMTIQIPDDVHLSDSEDIGADHLPKIKTRPDWLKPILEEETSETPEPD